MNVLFHALPLQDLQELVFQVSGINPLQKNSVQQEDVNQISHGEKTICKTISIFAKHDRYNAFLFVSCIN